jgi:hypothetical protein
MRTHIQQYDDTYVAALCASAFCCVVVSRVVLLCVYLSKKIENKKEKRKEGKDRRKKFCETMAVKLKSRALDGRDGPTRPNLLA